MSTEGACILRVGLILAALGGLVLALCGCAALPRVRLGKLEARGPAEPGRPASVATERASVEVPVPAGSVLEYPAAGVEGVGVGEVQPTGPVRLTFAAPATMRLVQERQAAQTGTIDTAVATRRADNQARQPLLWAAIAAAALAVPCVIYGWPVVASLCGAAGVVFFVAWQAAGLPGWFWVVGLAGLAVAGGLYLGYKRREGEARP